MQAQLLDDFKAINRRKRWNPGRMTKSDWNYWKTLRREIEKELFDTQVDPGADSRKFLRVPFDLEARYFANNTKKTSKISVLGEGGLFLNTDDILPAGTHIELEINVERKALSFFVEGEVVWSANSGMGVRFANMSYENKQMIYDLVDNGLLSRL
jgi:Tfp pilus assembly protein PilZ